MFLKSLTLKGFKSFADTANLEFEPGVTVVVGPNGSGKSNIVDAVAWVLGAQGARALRGAKMEDVIFAGTAKRQGLGRAEVSLTIDNSAGLLPIEFSEVRITRVLWRSGESEYSINGAPCRLLDVQELLSDTGVGRQQHTIISQAQLDSILSARAEDRRAVIEEAAGISKHRRRKERAQRRLESTEADLVRAQDLLKEVRRQLRPLERQADAARRHAGLVEELTALRRYLHGRELTTLAGRLQTATATRQSLLGDEEQRQAALATLESAVAVAEEELGAARAQADVADLAELVSAAEGLRARAAGTVALLHERALRIERDRAATVDGDLVSSLEAEAASLAGQLMVTEDEARQLLPRERELLDAEEALKREAAEVERLLAELQEEARRSAAERAAAEREAAQRAAAEKEAADREAAAGLRAMGQAAAPGTGQGQATDGSQVPGGAAEDAAPVGPAPAQQLGEVRAELAALRRSLEQSGAELRRVTARAEGLRARQARLREEAERAGAVSASADAAAPQLSAAAEAAAAELATAQSASAAAEEERRSAEAERHRWAARAEALGQALDEARARAGARRLAGVEGMLGALVELVEVDEGMEAAFEAAAGDALSAVLMEGEEAARQGLAHLVGQRAAGAVIALRPPGAQVAAAPGPPVLPEGAAPLRQRARAADPAVSRLLDTLLERAVVVPGNWAAAVDTAIDHPDLVVVTPAGDRCAGGTWRTGPHGTGATGAALEEARSALASATTRADAAVAGDSAAKGRLEQARIGHSEARRRAAENEAALQAGRAAYDRAVGDLAEIDQELEAAGSQQAELAQRHAVEQQRCNELGELLPRLESLAEQERQRVAAEREEARRRLEAERQEQQRRIEAERDEQRRRAQAERDAEAGRAARERAARERLAEHSAAVAVLRRDLEVRASGIEERRSLLTARLAEVERRLEGNIAERERAALRRAELEGMAVAVARLEHFASGRAELLHGALDRLRRERHRQGDALRAATDALEARRRELAAAERALGALRDQISKAELELAQLQGRLDALVETVRRDLECDPSELEGADCPELAPGTTPAARARDLERELRLMGPVNPLALEEFAELEERHKFLEGQLSDVSNARRELAKVIRAVDAEIISVFKSAYDDVAANFSQLVSTLFPGGQGSLSLTDPANILESGVEVEVKPVGKNVRRLSLLSGGERSLVALAFLFAVFRSRPSPFYMMDEVESALDDVNLHRFLDLVHEFRDDAQLLIVSHQKRTMEAADCLYGVSMPPGGSSVVVSQKVEARPSLPVTPQPGQSPGQ